ncbi:MAG: enterochelin esterase domain-containing protein, partial [Promethearchaeota archaeon]
MSPDDHPTSPRLTKLLQDLEKGDLGVLETFWQEVQTNTSPLIEPIEGDDHSLVTFLWRAEEELNGVSVISLITGLEDNKMTQMLETDLWYTTRRVKNDLRATYQLEPHRVDDRLAEGDDYEARIARFSRLKPDPFNPHTFVFEKDPEDPEGFELVRSVLEMPEAPAQLWIEEHEDVPKGKVELHRFRSDILDNERRVWVYAPPGYSPDDGREYGLIVLFDGKSYVDMVPTPTILDNLTAAERIKPMVAVIPDSLGMMTRIRELILNEDFNRFLVEELVPWVRENWSVTRDPSRVVVGGVSAGG